MWWNDYVGIPFEWHGSDRDGCSCWGLVRLVAREVFGRDLPGYDDVESMAQAGKCESLPYRDHGVPVLMPDVREGDVLHMFGMYNRVKLPLHVGIITEPGRVLHIEQGTASIVEKYTSPRCAWRVIGGYRFA